MANLTKRTTAVGLISALALIAMVSVPVYGEYERGPTAYRYETVDCTGTPLEVEQLIPNTTLDYFGIGTCINSSTVSGLQSNRYTCANGAFMTEIYFGTDNCTGVGFAFAYGTNLCFPGSLSAKREMEPTNAFSSFPIESFFSAKRLPGDVSNLIVCNPGESFTLVENTPVNTTVPELVELTPVPCASANNCTAGTAYATLFNSTARPEPTCDEPLLSVEFVGGAVLGECYLSSDTGFNMRALCTANSFAYESLPWGCDGPWFQRQEQFVQYSDQCLRFEEEDGTFFCPIPPEQPVTPTTSTPPPPPPSSASLPSPQRLLFFLSMALIAVVSLF